MIKGTKLWNDRKTFYDQTNNSQENIFRKELARQGKTKGFLRSCGPESAVNILASMGIDVNWSSPVGAKIQPGDALFVWMNDRTNAKLLKSFRTDIDPEDYFCNEIPQYYPPAIATCFGVSCRYLVGQTFDWIASMVSNGHGVKICLESPGHYLGVVAYDNEANELIYRDPWPGRTGTDGYNLRMGAEEFKTNTKPFCVVFGG